MGEGKGGGESTITRHWFEETWKESSKKERARRRLHNKGNNSNGPPLYIGIDRGDTRHSHSPGARPFRAPDRSGNLHRATPFPRSNAFFSLLPLSDKYSEKRFFRGKNGDRRTRNDKTRLWIAQSKHRPWLYKRTGDWIKNLYPTCQKCFNRISIPRPDRI